MAYVSPASVNKSQETPSILRSLTLGSYYESRFLPNNATFPFDTDDSIPVSINIESITASGSLEGLATLHGDDQTIYAPIDSTVPHLWLPRSVCDRFERAFGLLYDPGTDLYLANLTSRDTLLSNNASVFKMFLIFFKPFSASV
jgi:hypothetical protein